jgi:ribosome biogenesis GTPase / thiamine phosphate phosphatase
MKAIVYKSTGSWYTVKDEAGRQFNARMKGLFKIDDEITSTNPIAVGDEVEIETENELESSVTITGATILTVSRRGININSIL